MTRFLKIYVPIITILLAIGMFGMIVINNEKDLKPTNMINSSDKLIKNVYQKRENVIELWNNFSKENEITKDINKLVQTFKIFNIEDTIEEIKETTQDKKWYEVIGNSIYMIGETIVNYIKAPILIIWYVCKILIADIFYYIYALIKNVLYTIKIIVA